MNATQFPTSLSGLRGYYATACWAPPLVGGTTWLLVVNAACTSDAGNLLSLDRYLVLRGALLVPVIQLVRRQPGGKGQYHSKHFVLLLVVNMLAH